MPKAGYIQVLLPLADLATSPLCQQSMSHNPNHTQSVPPGAEAALEKALESLVEGSRDHAIGEETGDQPPQDVTPANGTFAVERAPMEEVLIRELL